MRLISHFAAMLAALGMLGAAAAQAQIAGDNRPAARSPPPPRLQLKSPDQRARFMVAAVRLHANNETGIDRAGSDEIVVAFHDPARNLQMTTSVFGDFDTGETRSFNRDQYCIAPVVGLTSRGDSWRCDRAGAPGPVSAEVVVLELANWMPRPCSGLGLRASRREWCGVSAASITT